MTTFSVRVRQGHNVFDRELNVPSEGSEITCPIAHQQMTSRTSKCRRWRESWCRVRGFVERALIQLACIEKWSFAQQEGVHLENARQRCRRGKTILENQNKWGRHVAKGVLEWAFVIVLYLLLAKSLPKIENVVLSRRKAREWQPKASLWIGVYILCKETYAIISQIERRN